MTVLACSWRAHADTPGQSVDGAYLVQTQTLTRHSDRAAQSDEYITAAAQEVFWRGKGELSSEGIENSERMGQAYRDIYVQSDFIDGRCLPKEVRFRSSDVNRVLMTSASFSRGLFREGNRTIVAPLTTVPYKEDNVLAVNYDCLLGWDDMISKYGLDPSQSMPNQILSKMRQLEWQCAQPTADKSDTIISEYANSKTSTQLNPTEKGCATGDAKIFMYNYLESLGGSGTNNSQARTRLQRTVGQLPSTIIANMRAMIECYAFQPEEYCGPFDGKAIYYFSHDVNELALINIFTFQSGARSYFQGKAPNFGSSLTFELWVKDDKYYCKVFIKNGVEENFDEFDICSFIPNNAEYTRVGRYCTVDALERAAQNYLDENEPECMPPAQVG